MTPSSWLSAGASLAALALVGLAAGEARAEQQPLRVDYEAHEGCPASSAFLEQVLDRTTRARAADPEEPALEVWVRVTRRGQRSAGRLVLWKSSGARAREVESDACRDVVSALALITALAIDPAAGRPRSAATSPPPEAAPAPPQPSPAPVQVPPGLVPAPPPWIAPLVPPPAQTASGRPGPPLQPPPAPPAPAPKRWVAGAYLPVSFEVTPRPLFGGGLFLERGWGDRLGVSARVGLDLAATGAFDVGPGGVSFLRGAAHLGACPLLRPVTWLAVAVCVDAEVGFLRGEGLQRGSVARVEVATVPWAALGVLPRVSADVGERALVALEGGPVFPLVRRAFVFEAPDYTIHDVPPVTAAVHVRGGIRF